MNTKILVTDWLIRWYSCTPALNSLTTHSLYSIISFTHLHQSVDHFQIINSHTCIAVLSSLISLILFVIGVERKDVSPAKLTSYEMEGSRVFSTRHWEVPHVNMWNNRNKPDHEKLQGECYAIFVFLFLSYHFQPVQYYRV